MKKRSRVVRFEMPAGEGGRTGESDRRALIGLRAEKEEEPDKAPRQAEEDVEPMDEGPDSSSSSGSGSSSSVEDDELRPERRRGKKQQPAGLDLATVFASIMNEQLPDNPILAKSGGFAGELKKRKIEAAVERQVAAARRRVREQWKKQPDPHERIEEERRLKKVATAGVVKLFNAINGQQRRLRDTAVPASSKAQRGLQQLTKESFLGALRAAPRQRSGGAAGAAWLREDFDADREDARDEPGGDGSEKEPDGDSE